METSDIFHLTNELLSIAAILGVWKYLSKKIEASGKKADSLDERYWTMVAEQMSNLASQREPEKTRGLDINFKDGNRYVVLLILGEWIQVTAGVKMQGMYEKKGETTYQIQIDNIWRIRPHSHTEREVVKVSQGTMKDIDSGKIYSEGEEWEIPAGEMHSVEFRGENGNPCIVMVTTVPELKPLNETPLVLDDLGGLVGQS